MRIVNSYIATQYHSKVHTCLEFSYYDEANETTTRFITLSIFSEIKRTVRFIPTNSNIFFLHQSIPIHIVKIIKQLANILSINKLSSSIPCHTNIFCHNIFRTIALSLIR